MLGHKNTEPHFSSGGAIEEIGHESNLSANVAFPDPFNNTRHPFFATQP